MAQEWVAPVRVRWARLRFSVIGELLALATTEEGIVRQRITELSQKDWQHPVRKGERIRFGYSTIERWYYRARRAGQDPLRVLERKDRKDAGNYPSMNNRLKEQVVAQYKEHPSWSYQLHYDNLVAWANSDRHTKSDDSGRDTDKIPSLGTVVRYMKHKGLVRQRRRNKGKNSEQTAPHQHREMRSFEVSCAHQLWHLDFHQGSRKLLTPQGKWQSPILLGILDDHTRLVCHIQWYWQENPENLVHGLCQALLKRGVPRALLTDNGGAMLAEETEAGLERLGIYHPTTLAYTPEQNGKQESFWNQIEGRLLPMLEGEPDLNLGTLNDVTAAWVEQDYNHKKHSELDCSPYERLIKAKSVARTCPQWQPLFDGFVRVIQRTLRRSDCTVSIDGVRFEIPFRYRSLTHPSIAYARWDLRRAFLLDQRSGQVLSTLLPIDKNQNANALRRTIDLEPSDPTPTHPTGMAPLLRQLMRQHAATGLPPAYIPKDEIQPQTKQESCQ